VNIVISDHARDRMVLRGVTYSDIISTLKTSKPKKNDHGYYVRAFVPGVKTYPLQVSFAAEKHPTKGSTLTVKTVFWKGLQD
jgi:hypothetical protein